MDDDFDGFCETDEIIYDSEYWRIKDIEMKLQHKKRCPHCNLYFVNRGIKSHINNCKGPKIDKEVYREFPCVFCGTVFDTNQKTSVHSLRCKKNPNRLIKIGHKYTKEQRENMSKAHKNSNHAPLINGVYHVVIKTSQGDVKIVITEDF